MPRADGSRRYDVSMKREVVMWCATCGRPNQDLALRDAARTVPGSSAYYGALCSWAPETCDCDAPRWEHDDD